MTVIPSGDEFAPQEVGTPKWWLRRLESELTYRTPQMDFWRRLVDGDHPLVDSPETHAKFTRMAGLATTNLCGLAVEATAERMVVKGIRVGGEPDADKQVWDDWQRSDFDAGSQEAITAALWASRSFISVSPPDGSRRAGLQFEDPRQVVLATMEGKRAAALKVFTDEWTGDTFGTLYLPDVVVKMVRKGVPGVGSRWIARPLPAGQDAVVRNPFGEVPFFELENKLTGAIGSEVGPLVTPQGLLNQTMFNIEAIAEYGAFRQKWATGIEVPRDPATGAPLAPFEAHISSLFVAEKDNVRFGDFNATDMGPHLDLAQKIAEHMARLARLPLPTFVPVANVSAEALAMMMAGLKFKCWRRVKGYEPAIESAVRLMMRANNDPRASVANIETDWAEMETFSMAQAADAAVKLTSGDNPVVTPQTAQERFLGMSQTERDRDDEWRVQGRATSNLDAILAAAQAAPLP